MSKPDDIPQDVWDAAVEAWPIWSGGSSIAVEVIARAILAERERCDAVARQTIIEARTGEIDGDLRSIGHILSHRIKSGGSNA